MSTSVLKWLWWQSTAQWCHQNQTWWTRICLVFLQSIVVEFVCFSQSEWLLTIVPPASLTQHRWQFPHSYTRQSPPSGNLSPPVCAKTSQDHKVGCRIACRAQSWGSEQRKSQLRADAVPVFWSVMDIDKADCDSLWQVITAALKMKALTTAGALLRHSLPSSLSQDLTDPWLGDFPVSCPCAALWAWPLYIDTEDLN